MELHERVKSIQTREELADFVEALLKDLRENGSDWENASLEGFLDAMAAWIRSMPSAYKNMGKALPSSGDWRAMADILLAAKMYE